MKKYEAIVVDLEKKIKSGALRASERLSSQSDLAQEYGVSLGTIQKSLRHLETNGLVTSVHGSGTYVTTGSPESAEVVNWRFRDENNRILPVYLKVEDVQIVDGDGPWRAHLGEDEVIAVRRVTSLDLQFTATNTVYLSRKTFDFILSMPLHHLDGHELTLLIDRQNLASEHFIYRIRGGVLSDRVCTLNQLDSNTRGLFWNIFGFALNDRPNWYQEIEVPLTKYSLEIFASGRSHIKQHAARLGSSRSGPAES